MADRPQEPQEPENPTGKAMLIGRTVRLLKGMAVLAVWLLMVWVLFGESRATPVIAAVGILLFLIYTVYVFAGWTLKWPRSISSRNRSAKPAVYYVSEHTPTTYSYVRSKPADMAETAKEAEAQRNTVTYRAHWAYFFRLALVPCFLLLLTVAIALTGTAQDWELLSAQGVRMLLILIIVFCLLWIGYEFLDWRNDLYIIDDESIKDVNQKPLSKREVKVAMISKIQTVQFTKHGFFQFIFDYGSLKVLSGESELTFDYVPHPEQVQKEILKRVETFEARQRLHESNKQQGFIDDLVSALRQNPEKMNDFRSGGI